VAKKKRYAYPVPTDPDKLAAKWHRLSGEHFSSYKRIREWCNRRLDRYLAAEERVAIGEETIELEDGTQISLLPSAGEVRACVQCLKDATEGERQALHMELAIDRVAIAKVQQLGFLLQLPDGAVTLDPTYAIPTAQPTEENQTVAASGSTINAIVESLMEP
jgi:hypothetical protein